MLIFTWGGGGREEYDHWGLWGREKEEMLSKNGHEGICLIFKLLHMLHLSNSFSEKGKMIF